MVRKGSQEAAPIKSFGGLCVKILNLYAGVGGNRTLWGDKHEVTAVEYSTHIAFCYSKRFPNDNVIVGDAMEYCLYNYDKFDFIWASPPCPTHSRMNNVNHKRGIRNYPDMSLWQLIIYLQKFSVYDGKNIKYCIENVIPYYPPLIKPTFVGHRHFFWANFHIPEKDFGREWFSVCNARQNTRRDVEEHYQELIKVHGFGLEFTPYGTGKRSKILQNCVDPHLAKYILDSAFRRTQVSLEKFVKN